MYACACVFVVGFGVAMFVLWDDPNVIGIVMLAVISVVGLAWFVFKWGQDRLGRQAVPDGTIVPVDEEQATPVPSRSAETSCDSA